MIINFYAFISVFTAKVQEPRLAVLPKAGLPLKTREPRLQFYQGLNRCSSFPLFPHPTISGPSGLHRNSPQGLNSNFIRVFDQIREMESRSPFAPFYALLNPIFWCLHGRCVEVGGLWQVVYTQWSVIKEGLRTTALQPFLSKCRVVQIYL